MKAMYNYKVGGTIVLPIPNDNIITIKAKVASVTTPSITPADYKYNKQIAFMQGFDDALYNQYHHAFKVYNGGTSSLSGLTYPGIRYSDGTGKMINAHGSLVLPAFPIKEPTENSTATFTWDDVNEMVAAGWSINNHSWKHGDTAPPNRYWDRLSDIKKAEQLFYDRAGYRTLVGTTPAAEEGFAFTFGILGYFCHNSTHNEFGQVPTIYGTADIASTPTTFFNLDRSYEGDAYSNEQAARMKAYIDEAWVDAKNGKKTFHNAFTHGPGEWQNFDSVTNYMLNNPTVTDSQNKIWLAGVQEYFEYRHTATASNITYNVNGEDLTITIDQTNVMDNVRDRSISLLCNGLTLSSITSVSGGQDITFNPATGLINLYNIDTSRLRNPSTDVLPAQIISVTGTGSNVTVTYDQAVNQTKIAGFSIADKTVTSLTGSGKVWNLGFNSSVSGTFLSYKSNFGDAVSLSTGKKVCDYISYPIL